jgi:ornithine carbamoyltransferase
MSGKAITQEEIMIGKGMLYSTLLVCLCVVASLAGDYQKDSFVVIAHSYKVPDQLRVAVIDIAAVFKGDQHFVESLKEIGKEMQHGLDENDRKSQEHALYLDMLERMKQEIVRCCERHNIQMVYRVNKEPLNETDPNDILRVINLPIPYFHPDLDITDEVVAGLNEASLAQSK